MSAWYGLEGESSHKKTNVEILKPFIADQDGKPTSRSKFGIFQNEGEMIVWESRLYIT